VPSPIPSLAAVFAQDSPSLRSAAILWASYLVLLVINWGLLLVPNPLSEVDSSG
jgi:hypothetical protein